MPQPSSAYSSHYLGADWKRKSTLNRRCKNCASSAFHLMQRARRKKHPTLNVSLYLKDTRVQQATADSSCHYPTTPGTAPCPLATSSGSRFICAQARITKDKRETPTMCSRSSELQALRLPLKCWPLFPFSILFLFAWQTGRLGRQAGARSRSQGAEWNSRQLLDEMPELPHWLQLMWHVFVVFSTSTLFFFATCHEWFTCRRQDVQVPERGLHLALA